MASCVVRPSIKVVMCKKCGCLYKPEKVKQNGYYENCPECHFCFNGKKQHISLLKYKFIRFKRESMHL